MALRDRPGFAEKRLRIHILVVASKAIRRLIGVSFLRPGLCVCPMLRVSAFAPDQIASIYIPRADLPNP